MMIRILSIFGMLLVLSGCATTGNGPNQGEVERISPEELQKLIPPAVATVSLDELIADAKQGKTADELIAKIKASHSRYDLTPAQSLALNQQGLDIKVLEYMHQVNELAKQNAIADEMNKRQRERALSEKKLKRERDLANMRYYDPYWGGGIGAYYGRPWIGSIGPMPYGLRHPYWGPRFGWGIGYGW